MFERLHQENTEESAEDSEECAQADVDEFVLAKDETGRTHQRMQRQSQLRGLKLNQSE